MVELVNKIKKLDGVDFSNGLESSIKQKEKELLSVIPKEFVEFYSLINGFCWNGIELFSIIPWNRKQYEYCVYNMSDFNEIMIHKDYLFFGRSDEDIFGYDCKFHHFDIIDRTGYDIYESFDTFEKLLVFVLTEREM